MRALQHTQFVVNSRFFASFLEPCCDSRIRTQLQSFRPFTDGLTYLFLRVVSLTEEVMCLLVPFVHLETCEEQVFRCAIVSRAVVDNRQICKDSEVLLVQNQRFLEPDLC